MRVNLCRGGCCAYSAREEPPIRVVRVGQGGQRGQVVSGRQRRRRHESPSWLTVQDVGTWEATTTFGQSPS